MAVKARFPDLHVHVLLANRLKKITQDLILISRTDLAYYVLKMFSPG